jgi:hypothetical protein
METLSLLFEEEERLVIRSFLEKRRLPGLEAELKSLGFNREGLGRLRLLVSS